MNAKGFLKSAVLFALVAGLGDYAAGGQPAPYVPAQGGHGPPEIVVHGQGQVAVTPDRAFVRLGVETQAKEAALAQEAASAVMQRAVTNITRLEVPLRAIKTVSVSLTPVYAQPKAGKETSASRIVAYRAADTLRIEVDNLSLVGQVIDAAMAAGVNRLEGVSFGLRNDLSERTAALRQAVARTQAKARAIAEQLDVRITGVSEVTEGGVNVVRPREFLSLRAAAATPIESGQVSVRASVVVHYRIAPGSQPESRGQQAK